MIPYLLNNILYFMSSCFRCKHSFYNGTNVLTKTAHRSVKVPFENELRPLPFNRISVSIDNSMIDFDRLNFDPGNMNKNFVGSVQLNFDPGNMNKNLLFHYS